MNAPIRRNLAMALLKKLPGFQRAPAGLERAVLRRLPLITVAGSAVLIGATLAVGLWLGSDPATAKLATSLEIALVSVLVLHWTVAFTVALACLIVLIAKGPAYVADAYELIDADRPAR